MSDLLSLRYSVEKKEKLGTRWVKCGKTSGPDCKYRVTDVIEGTEVQFQVSAENEAGVGHPSEPTEILTIEDPTGWSSGRSRLINHITVDRKSKPCCLCSQVFHLHLWSYMSLELAGTSCPSPGNPP